MGSVSWARSAVCVLVLTWFGVGVSSIGGVFGLPLGLGREGTEVQVGPKFFLYWPPPACSTGIRCQLWAVARSVERSEFSDTVPVDFSA